MQRERLPPPQRAEASALIVSHLVAWLEKRADHGLVASFAAIPREPVLADLPLFLPRWKFALPLALPDGTMNFFLVTNPATQLSANRLGFLEPDPLRCRKIHPADFSAILVPGEAFSPAGDRLGKGGGYYDRFLAHTPATTPRIGVAFSIQILPAIPTDPHDHPVDWLATELGVHRAIRIPRDPSADTPAPLC
jgi:5-formyltetrahydrofolate cyclo-ligase